MTLQKKHYTKYKNNDAFEFNKLVTEILNYTKVVEWNSSFDVNRNETTITFKTNLQCRFILQKFLGLSVTHNPTIITINHSENYIKAYNNDNN